MKVLVVKDVVRLLRSEVNRAKGQAAWASKTGINRVVVNKVLNGHGLPTKKIIRALKLRVVFVKELKFSQPSSSSVSDAESME
jgi:DNA-binding phage protein